MSDIEIDAPGVSEKTRLMLNKIVDVVSDGSDGDAILGVTSLTLAVHFFCLASGYEHASFVKNLLHLRDREEAPDVK
jgi:hypothetical protein